MELTQEMLHELLDYNPDTGLMHWKERGEHWFNMKATWVSWNKRNAGKEAGTLACQPSGYKSIRVELLGRPRQAHRVIWTYMTGEEPPRSIDHINRDATDNRWINLRDGTRINPRNKRLSAKNTSGVNGVNWSKSMGVWEASGTMNYKRYHLGYFTELDEAAMAAMEFRALHGFDPTHGLDISLPEVIAQ